MDDRLSAAGQDHLAVALDRLDGPAAARLAAQIADLDLDLIAGLVADLVHGEPHLALDELEPPDVVSLAEDADGVAGERRARDAGEAMLRAGAVAAVLVAGGQGTRLGFEGPKGAFPFAPVTGTTLFAHHAAKIAAIRRRYGCALPWYVMTSPQNDADTRAIFDAAGWYGLPPDSVVIFTQGTLPAVDRETGRILLDAPDRIALSPDGHGGLFTALARHDLLDDMRERGVDTFVTFNVDNPLIRIARPEFLGHHGLAGAEMSNIVVRKLSPEERVGVVARSRGRTVLVEYSDLPMELAGQREADGRLRFWAGSIAAHAIERTFAERITASGGRLPLHRAVKPVPFVDERGALVTPTEPNAVKFESFIFDALPLAERTLSVESAREDEFSPIKNATGDDSPDTARRDLNRLYARWLTSAGVDVPVDASGDPRIDIEIDPCYAMDADELAKRLPAGFTITSTAVALRDDARRMGGRTAPT